MSSFEQPKKIIQVMKKSILAMAIVALLAVNISCSESTPSGLQEDRNAPIARVGNVAENDTLFVEYEESGTEIEVEFLDETQLASYSIQIGSDSNTLIENAEEIEGTQAIKVVDISMLENNIPYSGTVRVEDTSGNTSSLKFVLMILFQEPVEIIYDEIYMVGDASPGGWDLGAQTPLNPSQSNPNIFSWTGELTVGEFKFKTYGSQDFCGGEWIHPMEQGQDLSETGYEIIMGCTGTDYKWVIDETSEGNYTIVIDLEAETIMIENQ